MCWYQVKLFQIITLSTRVGNSEHRRSGLFAQPGKQEGNKRLLNTIDAVSEKFGNHVLQVGVSRKPGK